jgi:hypothetical protein
MKKKINILPLNLNKSGCDAMSSNCVVWQGPDIPCLNICKGASITEVMYQIATSFCEMYATLDPDNYNYECLNIDECDVKTFQHLFQAVLDKVCLLEAGGCNMIVDINLGEENFTYQAVVEGGTAPFTYVWTPQLFYGEVELNPQPNGFLEINVTEEGTFGFLRLKVTDKNGCIANTLTFI